MYLGSCNITEKGENLLEDDFNLKYYSFLYLISFIPIVILLFAV